MSDGPYGFLVIGGGPAGLAAARAYREAQGAGAVAIVTDEGRVPYNRPPLTKGFLRGEITESDLPIEDERFLREQCIDLVSGRAVAVDSRARTVVLSGGRRLDYRQCLLATGAEPTRLPVPGCDDPGVRVVRRLDDVRELVARLGGQTPVVVVGSGFIGCEIAVSIRRRSHAVTLVSTEAEPNEPRLGAAAARHIHRWLEAERVELRLGAQVERIESRADGLRVHAAGGIVLDGQIVVMGAGVTPRVELAQSAGLELQDGAIPTDAAMRTAAQGLLAAGDLALAENPTAGRRLRVEHWGDALGQGEVAGLTAAGREARWDAVPGFWSTIGDRTLKYAAWGDGFDDVRFEEHADGAFTAWYGRDGRTVGVLAHERDEDYARGRELIAEGAPWR